MRTLILIKKKGSNIGSFLYFNIIMDTIYHENISCKTKRQYKTIDDANDKGKMQMYDETGSYIGPELYIYNCLYCNNFHLTQQKTDIKVF